jgi:hypothetical protein
MAAACHVGLTDKGVDCTRCWRKVSEMGLWPGVHDIVPCVGERPTVDRHHPNHHAWVVDSGAVIPVAATSRYS